MTFGRLDSHINNLDKDHSTGGLMSKKSQAEKHLSFEAQAAQAIKDEAERIARATQSPGQTKSETKRIAQGIAKGIETYKKQEKAKARERSKNQKKRRTSHMATENNEHARKTSNARIARLFKVIGNFFAFLSAAHFAIIFIPKQTLADNIQWLPITAVTLGIVYLMAAFLVGKIANRLSG